MIRKTFLGFFRIVKRYNFVADNLAAFMAFAGDDQHIVFAQLADARLYRLRAVADFQQVQGRACKRPESPAGFDPVLHASDCRR